VTVVEFDPLDVFVYLGVVLQYHHVTRHECPVQLVRDRNSLLGCVLVRFRYQDQDVLLVEVEIPDVCEYGAELADAVQFQELDLAINDGLLCERARG